MANQPNIPLDDYYLVFLNKVPNLLDESMDSSSYEGSLGEMFSIHTYIAFTMNKIIHHSQQNSEVVYQREMKPYADGNRLFRIFSFKNDRHVITTLIIIDSFDDERLYEKWTHFVESYIHGNEDDHDEAITGFI
ncbi:unnamed protein product [Rotaria sordida]|uniref:Sin3 C-terminal domain-containing protein n=1 Tax=Rotaria sordida TaxID=392033 RepID=A0A815YWH3_9BILA|nr:unnamed protein product [Rotaria sordida]CAF1394453.1 unnamed protein product [Rotaria sordida]CAF1575537.1 unnamed protein product [Rotaria sordida]CAF3683632.1 unnamed protein product [Rotaria sordida]CAF3887910.1 unnamed protein product [Rotaria sordida]